jgi:hypothetical protein
MESKNQQSRNSDLTLKEIQQRPRVAAPTVLETGVVGGHHFQGLVFTNLKKKLLFPHQTKCSCFWTNDCHCLSARIGAKAQAACLSKETVGIMSQFSL